MKPSETTPSGKILSSYRLLLTHIHKKVGLNKPFKTSILKPFMEEQGMADHLLMAFSKAKVLIRPKGITRGMWVLVENDGTDTINKIHKAVLRCKRQRYHQTKPATKAAVASSPSKKERDAINFLKSRGYKIFKPM